MAQRLARLLNAYLHNPASNKPDTALLSQLLNHTRVLERTDYALWGRNRNPTRPTWTVINTAITNKHNDVLRVLIGCLSPDGLKFVLVSPAGPLHRAAIVENTEAMGLMLESLVRHCGSDVLKRTLQRPNRGYPVLHTALITSSCVMLALIQKFVYRSGKLGDWLDLMLQQDRTGSTAMNRVVIGDEETERVSETLLNGMNSNAVCSVLTCPSSAARCPRDLARYRGNDTIAQFLMFKQFDGK